MVKVKFETRHDFYGDQSRFMHVNFNLKSVPGLFEKLSDIHGVEDVCWRSDGFAQKYKVRIEKGQMHEWADVEASINELLSKIHIKELDDTLLDPQWYNLESQISIAISKHYPGTHPESKPNQLAAKEIVDFLKNNYNLTKRYAEQ